MEKTEEFLKPKMTFGDTLRFTAYAYAKLLYIRDCGNTEVAGYGVTATEDPLLVTDFVLTKQECTGVTFDLDLEDGAEYMERMMDAGLMPWMYANLLIHSHPGNSPNPSSTDEINFQKAFSHPDWAIMLIIAKDDSMYCRLKLNTGPGVEKLLNVQVDFSQDFQASDRKTWKIEYDSKVTKQIIQIKGTAGVFPKPDDPLWWNRDDEKWVGFHHVQQSETDLEDLECYWSADGDVQYWDDYDDTWYTYEPNAQKWYIEDPKDNNGKMMEIKTPKKPWTNKVVAWAIKYANERDSILNDQCPEEEVEVKELI